MQFRYCKINGCGNRSYCKGFCKEHYFKSPECKFNEQRKAADRRCIAWELTYEQWLKIWLDSGHWNNRGKGKGKYCMARTNDIGPYAVGNVRITTFEANRSEQKFSDKTLEKMQLARLGKKQSAETVAKRANSNKGKKRSLEARIKMRQVKLGKKQSVETVTKKANANRGKKRSLETCLRISEGLINRYNKNPSMINKAD